MERRSSTPEVLERLEEFYGSQAPSWPTEPFEFLIWWHCGYPASDAACARGWESLNAASGVQPAQLLAASTKVLAAALAPGGMVPELRARRLHEIASRVQREFSGDLLGRLIAAHVAARKLLKKFPGISDPGADRILLFALTPVAAVPSNCPHVLVRILRGTDRENYGATYRYAQEAIDSQIAKNFESRVRAYLLLKRHGQELCKRTNPKCDACPVKSGCAYVTLGKG